MAHSFRRAGPHHGGEVVVEQSSSHRGKPGSREKKTGKLAFFVLFLIPYKLSAQEMQLTFRGGLPSCVNPL